MPRRAERPASCSDPAHIRAREACSAQRPWRMMQNTSRCRRVIGRRNLLLDARPVSCSDRAHIRAREACAAQRPWRMMQNTSRCRRVIGRRSTPAPLRAIEVSSEVSPGDEVVCGGSLLKGPRTLLNFSRKSPQFVPVPFGLCTITRIEAHRIQVEQLGCKDRGYVCTRQRSNEASSIS